jgi:RNA-directed DNA polymerase
MDRDLAKLAMSHRCFYTRYADDLVFSTDRNAFPTSIASMEGGIAQPSPQLQRIIGGAGFSINERKTRLQIEFQRQRVTGLVVNQKVNVSRTYLRGVRALLHIWRKHGPEQASKSVQRASADPNWPPGKPYPGLPAVIRGRVQYIGSVRGWDDPAYLKLAQKLSELDPHFDKPDIAPSLDLGTARLYTEGTTDVPHIRAALKFFHERGEFTNLRLAIDEETPRGNDHELKKYLENLVEFGTQSASVGLFDWDSKHSKQAVGEDGWLEYGRNVVAVGIAPPAWRDPLKPRCIELLHEDSVLDTKDPEGRRIYRMNEFNDTTSIHESEPCVVPYAGKDKEHLIAVDVYEVGTNFKLSRSKAAFARAIEEEPETFPNLTFEGFRSTFDRIVIALECLKMERERRDSNPRPPA